VRPDGAGNAQKEKLGNCSSESAEVLVYQLIAESLECKHQR
jgi:hypothetical protein